MTTLPIASVVFREDLYPRKTPDQARAQLYSQVVELLPPIEVNQDNILIDGWHRWTAYQLVGAETIAAKITKTKSDTELKYLAGLRNARHGSQLKMEEKRKLAREIVGAGFITKDEFALEYGISRSVVYEWMSEDDGAKRLRELSSAYESVLRFHLQCFTDDQIAAEIGQSQQEISKKIELLRQYPDLDKTTKGVERDAIEHSLGRESRGFGDFSPPIYNIWAFGKKTNTVEHFGNTEERIVENLLWLYTQPFEIVIDPFGGGGSTLDVCERRLRRCWISDRKPKPGLERRIRKLDICEALPELNKRWSEVALVYLDPPYWRQAQNQYSKDREDLANMPLEQFTDSLANIVKRFVSKLRSGAVVALIIQPTQWKSEPKGAFTDHVFDLIAAVGNKKATVENRISCPYSTEQCTPQMVEWAKEHKRPLVLSRELIIWRVI